MTQAIFTIVSNNYLHYARTLLQSVALHHPLAKRYCVIVDTDMGPARELAAEFDALPMSVLGLPFGEEFAFQYTILELNTAVKPWALQYLLDQGHEQVLYIDPDICLYQPLTEVEDLLHQGASIVVTPHLLAPVTDTLNPDELAIRMAGTYNLGFCAIAEHPAARRFLTWWQGKLSRNCIVDFSNGVFVDQSWVDLAPGLFEDVAILRHPGYNVAYWNIAQRDVVQGPADTLVNGAPLRFFHYSGIDPQKPDNVSKHQNRYTLDSVQPTVKTLIESYCAAVVANGIDKYRSMPYGFATFADGTAITPAMRTKYRTNADFRRVVGAQPFQRVAHFVKPAARAAALRAASGTANNVSAAAQFGDGAGDDIEDMDVAQSAVATARMHGLYQYFLGRAPDPSAMRSFAPGCDTVPGYLRVAAGIGRSAESRRNPHWKRRLMLWPVWKMVQRLLPHVAVADVQALPPPINVPVRQADIVPASSPIGINLVGYIAAELGIGEAARSLARSCSASAVPYSVIDVGYQSSNLQRDTQALANASNDRFPIDLIYVNADQTSATLNHLQALGLEAPYRIGFWHWEQPQIPAAHLAAFTYLNEIWVPSAFVYHAVAAVSPRPVVIIPHAIDVRATPGDHRARFGLPADKASALMMYDFHSYQYRKNPQAAIAAFRQAMQGRSDAVLVVKTINGHHHPETAADLHGYLADLPGTVIIDEFLTRQETWDLQASCDLLISLHRAEGFGLAPAEMMALGKPVVATGWSANMDFMTPENSMPVHYRLEPLREAVGAYPAGPLWAEADIDHAAACIRDLLDQPQLRQRLGRQAALDIQTQLSPAAVGKLIRARLEAIRHWHPVL